MLELLKFFFSYVIPALAALYGVIRYSKYNQLERLENLLERSKALSDQEGMANTKEYLEKKKANLLKCIATSYQDSNAQDKFLLIYKKCGGYIPDLILRLFMPYTQILETNKLIFNLNPFYKQTKILYLMAIPSLLFLTCFYYFLYLKFSSIILFIETLIMFTFLIFTCGICFYYYKNIKKYKSQYIELISLD